MVSRWPGAVLVLALGAGAVLASVWLWRARGDEVAPIARDRESGAVAADAGTAAPSALSASPAPTAVQREEVGASRVTGVVLDAAGEVLAGASVVLSRRESPPPVKQPVLPFGNDANPLGRITERALPSSWTTSDANGAFGFADVAPAEYTVTAAYGASTSQTFTLAAGERRHVELRFPASETVLFGQLRGAAVGEGSHVVQVSHGTVPRTMRVGADGGFRGLVEAGPRTVRVMQCVFDATGHRTFVAVDERHVTVARGARLRCDFDLPSGRIDVTVDDPGSASTSDLQFVANGGCGLDGVEVELWRSVVGAGASFENLPLGRWRIGLRGASAILDAEQQVELTANRPTAHVALKVRRAGCVRVRARDLAGQGVALAGAGLLLATSLGELRGTDIGRTERGRGVAEDFGFAGVPLGRAELIAEDRDVDGRRVFLPFEPLPRQPVEVAAGDQNRIELRVERRALVQLRAVDRVGREERTARIAVFAGQKEIAAGIDSRASYWRAHLPPGDFRIVVERTGSSREHALQVARQNVEWKLRP